MFSKIRKRLYGGNGEDAFKTYRLFATLKRTLTLSLNDPIYRYHPEDSHGTIILEGGQLKKALVRL